MGQWQGKQIELAVENVAHGGIAVARCEGRVVFVADSLPGEVVRARISDDRHAAFWRAETLSVVQASPHRVPHVWGSAALELEPDQRAGGAEFGHIELAWQRELKRQVVIDSLQRFADQRPDVVVEAVGDDDQNNGLGWRTRVSLHVDSKGFVGPYAARSHRVIAVPDLPLATLPVEHAAPLAGRFIAAKKVDIVADDSCGARVIVHRGGRGSHSAKPSPSIVERVADRPFLVDEQGFWQVHRGAAETLYHAVQQQVIKELFDPSAANLDLYGGVGLFAASLADRFGSSTQIISVESDPVATENAAKNLSDWTGATAQTGRVDDYLAQLRDHSTARERTLLSRATVILDPPRSGAGKQVVQALLELAVAQVIYVACDPVSFARDLAQFGAGGYTLRTFRAFDLFPHTHHVETIAVLVAE